MATSKTVLKQRSGSILAHLADSVFWQQAWLAIYPASVSFCLLYMIAVRPIIWKSTGPSFVKFSGLLELQL